MSTPVIIVEVNKDTVIDVGVTEGDKVHVFVVDMDGSMDDPGEDNVQFRGQATPLSCWPTDPDSALGRIRRSFGVPDQLQYLFGRDLKAERIAFAQVLTLLHARNDIGLSAVSAVAKVLELKPADVHEIIVQAEKAVIESLPRLEPGDMVYVDDPHVTDFIGQIEDCGDDGVKYYVVDGEGDTHYVRRCYLTKQIKQTQ